MVFLSYILTILYTRRYMKMIDSIYYLFDKMEDHIRARLARHPFVYTFIGGAGVVLFWRGVWHMADVFEKTSQFGGYLFSPLGSTAQLLLRWQM